MIAGIWFVPETTGEILRPCAAAFTKVDQHTAVLFGGRQKQGRVNDLAILNMEKWVRNCIHAANVWGVCNVPLAWSGMIMYDLTSCQIVIMGPMAVYNDWIGLPLKIESSAL